MNTRYLNYTEFQTDKSLIRFLLRPSGSGKLMDGGRTVLL